LKLSDYCAGFYLFIKSVKLIRNIIYIIGGIIVFFAGLVTYGIILNIREVSLNEAMTEKKITELNDVYLIVKKKNFRVELYSDSVLVKSYKAVFGKNQGNDKRSKDDFITPVGDYRICKIDSNSKFNTFFQINYPNEKDITEAYREELIDKKTFLMLRQYSLRNDCSDSLSLVSAEIGIHGMGRFNFIFKNLPFAFNWTNGSVAVSDESITELKGVIKIGTKVTIVN